TDLARERVVEGRELFALDVLQRDANGLALSALCFVREVIRPAHRAFDCLAWCELHRELLDAWNRLTGAEHESIVLALRHRAIFVGRRQQYRPHIPRCGLGLDGMPAC